LAILSLIRACSAPVDSALICHWQDAGAETPLGPRGTAALGAGGSLVFALTQQPVGGALCSAEVALPDGSAVLRVDEVAFPEGAIAYRHIHPGPGIRTLVDGQLRLISDHDTQVMSPGDSWFEGANSPVRAENMVAGVSRFVRAMILPAAFEGHPSIDILAQIDRDRPRLQVTHRHIDHVFTL
jgi:quercetin dioxygenase-like cupin family protein